MSSILSDDTIETIAHCLVWPDQILITPFRSQNVPPPMSSYQLELPSPPVHIAFTPNKDELTALLSNGTRIVWDLHTKVPKKGKRGGGKIAIPTIVEFSLLKSKRLESTVLGLELRQVARGADGKVMVLARDMDTDRDVVFIDGVEQLSNDEGHTTDAIEAQSLGRILAMDNGVVVCDSNGRLSAIGR